jgi:hypothetical protein
VDPLDPRGKWCGVETRQQVVNPGDCPYVKSVYAAREGSEPLIERWTRPFPDHLSPQLKHIRRFCPAYYRQPWCGTHILTPAAQSGETHRWG